MTRVINGCRANSLWEVATALSRAGTDPVATLVAWIAASWWIVVPFAPVEFTIASTAAHTAEWIVFAKKTPTLEAVSKTTARSTTAC